MVNLDFDIKSKSKLQSQSTSKMPELDRRFQFENIYVLNSFNLFKVAIVAQVDTFLRQIIISETVTWTNWVNYALRIKIV